MSIIYRAVALGLLFLVYVIGLIGNGLLIFIVFRQKNLQTVPNLLVVSLALGDFLFVLFCVPFGAVAYAVDYYPFPTSYCRFENFIINLSLGVSVFSLLALSADRYKIIVTPFSSHANDPSIKLKTVFIMIWLLSILLALPETFYSGLISLETSSDNNTTSTVYYCWSPSDSTLISDKTFMITRQVLRLIIYYLMPLIFVSIFYILIAKNLFRAKNLIFTPSVSQPVVDPAMTANKNSKIVIDENEKQNRKLKDLRSIRAFLDQKAKKEVQMSDENQMHPNNYRSKDVETMSKNNNQTLAGSSQPLTMSKSTSTILESFQDANKNQLHKSSSLSSKKRETIQTLYQNAKTRKQLKARRKVAKTVLFLCIVFFICWLPKQIHDLYWFIGVLVYSARWNHFWQLNKTLAQILSYLYSCINPFALYFLSSTFRHFYNRYLFFWRKQWCFRPAKSFDERQGPETLTFMELGRRSSANNSITAFSETNRIRLGSFFHQQNGQARVYRYVTSQKMSSDSEI